MSEIRSSVLATNSFQVTRELNTKTSTNKKEEFFDKAVENNSSNFVHDNTISKGMKNLLRSFTAEAHNVEKAIISTSSLLFPDEENENSKNKIECAAMGIRG